MVGTFYRAPSPGAPPFVEIGQSVRPLEPAEQAELLALMQRTE